MKKLIINPPVGDVYSLISELKSSGKIFTAVFRKKDGSTRKMNCRCRVTSHLKGGKLGYNATKKGLLPVFDLVKGEYRTVNLNTLVCIAFRDNVFYFDKMPS